MGQILARLTHGKNVVTLWDKELLNALYTNFVVYPIRNDWEL